jgi:hypothetical protein
VSTANPKFGSGCAQFGSGKYLSIPGGGGLQFTTGDFTISFWVNFTSVSGYQMFFDRDTSHRLYYYNNVLTAFGKTFSWSPSAGTWYHLAVVRSGSSLMVFVDGSQIGTTQTHTVNLSGSGTDYIGTAYNQSQFLTAYLDDIAVYKYAKWTSNFTPPSSAVSSVAECQTGVLFQPDLVWIKSRWLALSHAIYDSVRGATKELASNTTDGETTQTAGMTAFNSGGFSTGERSNINSPGATFVDWMFRKSPLCGLDIVSCSHVNGVDQTVSHTLGAVPEFMIRKLMGGASNWEVYHKNSNASPKDYLMYLNATDTPVNAANIWGSSGPDVSSIYLPSGLATGDYINILVSGVLGFSKIGAFTANKAADGLFVYTGFRPQWILWKAIDTSLGWRVSDSARVGYNPVTASLLANSANAESASDAIDFLSNGFKCRSSGLGTYTYIYVAFAECPSKVANAR